MVSKHAKSYDEKGENMPRICLTLIELEEQKSQHTVRFWFTTINKPNEWNEMKKKAQNRRRTSSWNPLIYAFIIGFARGSVSKEHFAPFDGR